MYYDQWWWLIRNWGNKEDILNETYIEIWNNKKFKNSSHSMKMSEDGPTSRLCWRDHREMKNRCEESQNNGNPCNR